MRVPFSVCHYLHKHRPWRSFSRGYNRMCQTCLRVRSHATADGQQRVCGPAPVLSRSARPLVTVGDSVAFQVDGNSQQNREKRCLYMSRPHRLVPFLKSTPYLSAPVTPLSGTIDSKLNLWTFLATCNNHGNACIRKHHTSTLTDNKQQSQFLVTGSANMTNGSPIFSIDRKPNFIGLHQSSYNNRRVMSFSSVRLWHANIVLTPQQTRDVLQQNAMSVIFGDGTTESEAEVNLVTKYDSNQLSSNKPGEDRRAAAECRFTDGMMFGVFDGHRGPACAQAVSERLFNYIAAEMLPYSLLPQVVKELKQGNLNDGLVTWHRHPNDYTLQSSSKVYLKSLLRYVEANLSVDVMDDDSVSDMLKTAFERLDKDFSNEAIEAAADDSGIDAINNVYSGSCACVAFVQGRDLYIANVGDCRAVLGRISNGRLEAVPLTVDQNADNVNEVNRLKSNHPPGESSTVIKNGRLLAELMPLRAFGDVRYKWTADMQRQILRAYVGDVLPKNYYTPPYLTATPEIVHHQITDGDQFLILATDGLWDMLTCEKAVSLVGEHKQSMKASEPYRPRKGALLGEIQRDLHHRRAILKSLDTNSATHLTRYALCGVSNEFDLDRLAEVLSYPASVARQHRDDITVSVIYFN